MLKKIPALFILILLCISAMAQEKENPGPSPLPITKDSLSRLLGMRIDSVYNPILYATVVEWLGTRYRYGGRTKNGIDCSDFTSILYKNAYNIDLAGSAGDIFKKSMPISKSELKEGDMVFFKIRRRRRISHVGVYLGDNKFAHATTKAGVVISDLSEPYYKKYFFKGGTISDKKLSALPNLH
jgi:lipoprotein Spr